MNDKYLRSKGNLYDKLMGARNILSKKYRRLRLYTSSQLASDILCALAIAADPRASNRLPYNVRERFEPMTRSEILCEICLLAQQSLLANFEKYGFSIVAERKAGFFSREYDRLALLRKNISRLTEQQILEPMGVESRWGRHKKEINIDDVHYGRFLREHGLTDMKGAEITEEDDPMDLQTALRILGFFEKPKTIEQATDEAARKLLGEDGVNPGIIDRIIRNAFGSLYNSVPDAHERVIERARSIFREERRNKRR